jgi:type IV secretion system protein VirD4
MNVPAVAEAVTPAVGQPAFDVDEFLDGSNTLYLLGADRQHGSIAPLFSCLTSEEVYERAIVRASHGPGGRLDPPLLLALDEVAAICPVPLDRWTAVAGGWGIPIAYAVQTPSQLYDRWGQLGGKTIWSNTTTLLVLGGLSNAEYLRELSELTGERAELVTTVSRDRHHGPAGSSTAPRSVPVMTPAAIRMLRQWRALVLHRNMAPVETELTPIWQRST